MSESSQHVLLKEVAKEILKIKGYIDIREEFPVVLNGHVIADSGLIKVKKSVYADVVGFKEGYSIVVECGSTPSERLSQFKLFFDEVLYLPFVENFKELVETKLLHEHINKLQQEKRELEQNLAQCRERLKTIDNKVREALVYPE
jgi:hypothetical protein